MAIEDYFTSTVTRKVLSTSDSVYGKDGDESFSGSTTFLARIWKLKANEVVLDESQRPLVTNRAACGASNTVLYTDRWAIEGADLLDGWDFAVSQEWSFSNVDLGWTSDSFTTNAAGGAINNIVLNPSRTLVAGSTYEVIIEGSTDASSCSVYDGQTGGVEIGALNGAYVFKVNENSDGKLFIKNAGAGATTITKLELRLVSATYDIISVNLNEDKTSSHHYELELRLV